MKCLVFKNNFNLWYVYKKSVSKRNVHNVGLFIIKCLIQKKKELWQYSWPVNVYRLYALHCQYTNYLVM